MPGDPRECRLRAARCAELAQTARSTELKAMLINLSKNWEQMANELERAQALMQDSPPTVPEEKPR
jgi:hypothetical protein